MSDLPVLYSFRRCPYAIRARLALAVSGANVELHEVALRNKPAAMIAASPKGTVPVLVLPDGRVIDESLAIMRWALAMSDPEGWLAGDDRALIAANDGPFKHHLDCYKYHDRYAVDPQEHRAAATALLDMLEMRLRVSHDLAGARPSLTDFALLPFVRQFAAVDRDYFDALAMPNLQDWLNRHVGSALFEGVMAKPALAPNAGDTGRQEPSA